MTTEQWQRIEAILGAALECDGLERAVLVKNLCGDDRELRAEVESLLAVDAESDQAIAGVVEGSAAALSQGVELGLAEGERLGIYSIVREIGRGGMGTVYLAERADEQFQKRVAIKLVTRGMDTAALLGRFRQERQILARLDNPYIARLLDGGSTPDGRPYLVIDYVEGQPITVWCAGRELGLHERIALFLKVCSAVQSAHQNLVVHRDLKPANILVDADGSPKLLDFGIAKLLGPDDGPEFTVAAGGMRLLTPDYASPEQVRGEPITTATDVYSLGAILYELVSGVRPHRLRDYGTAEIERSICDEVPERPSLAWKRLETANGQTRPPALAPGDLDNIILMAMQKEPSRRYGSVAELAEDLRGYLGGRPVRAREDTLTYRARKFVRRNRAGVAAAALLVATLAAGVTVSTIQAARAQRRFNEVRRLAHAVLYDIYDEIHDLPGSAKAREKIVKTALEYLDGLARESAAEPGLRLELAQAYERIGDVQGDVLERSLGKTSQALESYRKAMKIADDLAAGPESAKANHIRERMRESIGDIYARRGDVAGALNLYRQGAAIGEEIARREPSNRQNLLYLSEMYMASAREDSDVSQTNAQARKAVSIMEGLTAVEPGNEDFQATLAAYYSVLSSILAGSGNLDEAVENGRKALRIRESLVAAHPMNARYRRFLMMAHAKMADALDGNNRLRGNAESIEHHRMALALAEGLAAADPADRHAAMDLGMALVKMAAAMPMDKDAGPPVAMLRRALTAFLALTDADPSDARAWEYVASAYLHIGRRLAVAGDTAGALRSQRETIRICEDVIGRNPKNKACLSHLWKGYQEAAKALVAGKQRTEALNFSRKAIESAEAGRAIDGTSPVTRSWLPEAYESAGTIQATVASAPDAPVAQRREDWRDALESYRKAIAGWESIQSPGRDGEMAKARAGMARCVKAMASLD